MSDNKQGKQERPSGTIRKNVVESGAPTRQPLKPTQYYMPEQPERREPSQPPPQSPPPKE